MKINYWKCKYGCYDEIWDGVEETRIYGCSHKKSLDNCCDLNNKYAGTKQECILLDIKDD
jgi:hypothetical protein